MTKTNREHLQILKYPGLRALLLTIAASGLNAVYAYGQSVPLPPGSIGIPLPGTTAFAEPDLAGPIVADQFIPFAIGGPTNAIITGVFEDRVDRESLTGNLDFYGRLTITDFGNNQAGIESVSMADFTGFGLNANYRTDGLGVQGPDAASRSGDGSVVAWYFDTPQWLGASGGASESLFFFAQTDAQNFDANGNAHIGSYDLFGAGLEPEINMGGIYEPVAAPEPATLSLAALGGIASLVLARRRK